MKNISSMVASNPEEGDKEKYIFSDLNKINMKFSLMKVKK